jgi:FAD/FMN-containing dehydrogenase
MEKPRGGSVRLDPPGDPLEVLSCQGPQELIGVIHHIDRHDAHLVGVGGGTIGDRAIEIVVAIGTAKLEPVLPCSKDKGIRVGRTAE